jgi:hypothetical protein
MRDLHEEILMQSIANRCDEEKEEEEEKRMLVTWFFLLSLFAFFYSP